MRFLSRHRDLIISIALLAIPFFFLKANFKDPSQLGPFDRVVLALSAPIQYVLTGAVETAGDLWLRYVWLVGVAEENERLRFENQRLVAESYAHLGTVEEVRRLRQLLTFQETFGGELLAAKVVGRGTADQFRILRLVLDRGAGQVAKGMPVVTFDGLVGQISRVAGRSSEVILTVDRKSQVPVMVQRNGAQGILRGTGELDRYSCEVEYLLRSDEVREGDQLFTSGAGGKFPEGLLVGRILTVQKENLGLFQKVLVEPAVNFSRVREVFVLTTPPDAEELDADEEQR